MSKSESKRKGWVAAAISSLLLGLNLTRWGPELWLTDVALEFTPIFLVLSAIVTLVCVARKNRLPAVLSFGAVVMFAASVNDAYSSTHAGEPKGSTTLKITQANLLKVRDTTAAALELVSAEKPDILVLYEFTSQSESLVKSFAHVSRRPYREGLDMVICSRFPVERFQRGWKVDVHGRTLTVYSIHPVIPDTPSKWAERNRVLRATADHTRAPGPMILVGDFNTTPFSGSFRYVEQNSGLRNSARGKGYFGSWPSPGLLPLDHLFVSKDIAIVDKHVSMGIGSDHRPITTVIRF